MWLEIARLTISVERSIRFWWLPVIKPRLERDPVLQDYYNVIWYADVHWLWWWIQLDVCKDRGRWWWQRN